MMYTRSIVFPYYYNIIMRRTLNRVQAAAIRLFIVGFFLFFFFFVGVGTYLVGPPGEATLLTSVCSRK